MVQIQSLLLAKTFAKYTEQKRIYAKSGDFACQADESKIVIMNWIFPVLSILSKRKSLSIDWSCKSC